jgi:hypothetical protein
MSQTFDYFSYFRVNVCLHYEYQRDSAYMYEKMFVCRGGGGCITIYPPLNPRMSKRLFKLIS